MVVSIGIVSNATVDLAKHLSFPTVIYSHVVSTIMELILVALLCIILSRDVYIYIYICTPKGSYTAMADYVDLDPSGGAPQVSIVHHQCIPY